MPETKKHFDLRCNDLTRTMTRRSFAPEEIVPLPCRTHMDYSPADAEAVEEHYKCKFSARTKEAMIANWIAKGVLPVRL
jgi:hypothetical protein